MGLECADARESVQAVSGPGTTPYTYKIGLKPPWTRISWVWTYPRHGQHGPVAAPDTGTMGLKPPQTRIPWALSRPLHGYHSIRLNQMWM